ncbi:MAG: hypothetical protein V4448_09305 [Pseudomonadota bacterium]|uniref:hypothetical protein n=1 Tax=Herminiimonas arsenitoxidans TaxID=1809410 RepID=UPI0009706E46|nr:hypothetical protein [Herminiimonas arsenitoxidans]
MSDQQTETAPTEETYSRSEILSFCRHLGRTLKGSSDESNTALAMHLMREAEYLGKNKFETVADMFAAVAHTVDPNLPKK